MPAAFNSGPLSPLQPGQGNNKLPRDRTSDMVPTGGSDHLENTGPKPKPQSSSRPASGDSLRPATPDLAATALSLTPRSGQAMASLNVAIRRLCSGAKPSARPRSARPRRATLALLRSALEYCLLPKPAARVPGPCCHTVPTGSPGFGIGREVIS